MMETAEPLDILMLLWYDVGVNLGCCAVVPTGKAQHAEDGMTRPSTLR